jgi:hypothetical protein
MAKSTAVEEEVQAVEEVQETGIYEGLAAIRKYKEDLAARKAAAEANKINWLKMEDNEVVRIWILQELDRGAENYKESNGIGLMATEHANPENWRLKALCTASEFSQCLGCEKHKEDWRAGWKQKSRIYLNVLVERKDGTREVAVMSQANGPQSTVGPLILELAVDENTITNRWYKLTKVVNNGKISYSFVPNMKESSDVDPAEYADQLYDLHKAVRKVAYEDQFDYYFRVDENAEKPEEKPTAPSWSNSGSGASADEEW